MYTQYYKALDTLSMLTYATMILLYVVILVCKSGKITGKSDYTIEQNYSTERKDSSAAFALNAEWELTDLLSQRQDGIISEEEYNRQRSEIIRRL